MLPAVDVQAVPKFGREMPRVAPPLPAHALLDEWRAGSDNTPMPWQLVAARYMMAVRPDGNWLFPSVAILAGRQNGKTELIAPRIKHDLRRGRRVLHTAHRMRLVRMRGFNRIRDWGEAEGCKIRATHGEEEILHPSGGSYAIVAALRGARGDSADTLIIDEAAEFEDYEALAATGPTLTASDNPQTILLTTAGTDASVVLNAFRRRAEDGDPRLAYLEWSANPERSIDDLEGWAEANPAIGHLIDIEFLREQRKLYAEDPIRFEREHLGRWDPRTISRVVAADAWTRCHADTSTPERPVMGVNMDGQTSRASAVIAWRLADGRIGLRQLVDARGTPLDTDALHDHLRSLAVEYRVRKVGYASWTDASLTQGWRQAKAIDGKEFTIACGQFAELVNSGRLAWDGEELIGDDLAFTTRKAHETGAWVAVPASTERPITAALAAIRAVHLASERHALPRIG